MRFLSNRAEKSLVQPDPVFIVPEIDKFYVKKWLKKKEKKKRKKA